MTNLLQQVGESASAVAWLEVLLGAVALATIVIALAFVVSDCLLRRASAARRHVVWLLTLVTVLVGPGVSWMFADGMFRWDGGPLVTRSRTRAAAERGPDALASDEAIGLARRASGSRAPTATDVAETLRFDPGEGELLDATVDDAQASAPADALGQRVAGVGVGRSASLSTPSISIVRVRTWVVFGLVIWAAVAALLILLVPVAALVLSMRRRSCRRVTDGVLRERIAAIGETTELSRVPTVLLSDADCMPMTWGVLRPVILLPPQAGVWDEERLRIVLLHEFAHVRRRDCLWQIASVLACSIHWFNPLVWKATGRMRAECERACDDLVLAGGVAPSRYAEQLLDLSTGGNRGVVAMCAGLAMARPRALSDRLSAIVDDTRDRRPVSRSVVLSAVCGLLLALVPVSLISVRVTAASEPDAGPVKERIGEASDTRKQTEPASGQEDNRSPSTGDVTQPSLDDVPDDMRFVEEGRRRLAKIPFTVWDFTFVRVKYSSFGRHQRWATDFPDADLAVSQRIDEWTSMNVHRDGAVKSLTDPELQSHPMIYVSEPGAMALSDDEVVALRRYLSSGGILMADDFWGDAEWQNLQTQMKRVFPDMTVREVPDDHRLFRWPFRLPKKPQVCSIGAALVGREAGVTWERNQSDVHYWWILNDNRVVALCCHNTDLGDGWERQDASEWYAREFSEKRAYPMMMNILTFVLANPLVTRPGQTQVQRQRDAGTGATQQIHPAVLNSSQWLDLQRRLESGGIDYRSVDVGVTKTRRTTAIESPSDGVTGVSTVAPVITLDMAATATVDLTALQGAAIDSLDLSDTAVADLSPLTGMSLRELDLSGTLVEDLSPLRGMPLEKLCLSDTPVADLSPLAEARLTVLEAASTPVAELGALRGQPVTYLDVRDTRVTDLGPISEAPLQVLRMHGAPVTSLRPLLRTPLKLLGLEWRPGVNLGLLSAVPLNRLVLSGRQLSDISPLANLQLESLDLRDTGVTDLSPLAGLPLRELNLQGTPATDLTPLRAMDLGALILTAPGVDLRGIKDTPVFFLQLPDPGDVENFEQLRSMNVRAVQAPGTERLSLAKFLTNYDRARARQVQRELPVDDAKRLIRDLRDGDAARREQAARRLESFGPAAIAAVQPLILTLNDQVADVVRAAGDALEAMGPAAAPALLNGMDHEDPWIRHRCGFALSNIRPVDANLISRLIDHLSDEHQRVRLYAVISLGNLRAAAAPAVPALISMLASDDQEIRRFAVESLGEIGPDAREAVPTLIQLIGRNPAGRAEVALGRIGPDAASAVPLLIKRYNNGYRANTLWALARIGRRARAAIPVLLDALHSRGAGQRERARLALATLTGDLHIDTRVLPVTESRQ